MPHIFKDFSAFLKSSERSSSTVKNYIADLQHFEKWLLETNGYSKFIPADITPTDLREFKQFLLMNKELKPASINRRLASLRSFLKWANAVGHSINVPLSKIPKFEKTEKTGIRWLDRKEENALLRMVERNSGLRDITIIKLLLNTGMRVSELCSMRWSEVVISERKGTLTVLQGQGGKRRKIPLNYDARQVLLDLGYKQNAGKKDWIFVGQRGKLTPRGVQTLFRKYADPINLNKVSPHTLRHTFCKNLLNAGIGLEKIAILAGHESLDTTRLQLEPFLKDLANAVEAISEEQQMPSRFLINAERERLESFPKEIGDIDKTAFFTLTEGDLEIIKRRTGEENRFGFAILLCCLRFLGFIPIDLSTIPNEVFEYLAGQIELEETKLPIYERSRTKQTQIKEIFAYTGFRRIRKKDLEILESWLVRRAADGDSRRTFMGERFLSFCQPRNISDPE